MGRGRIVFPGPRRLARARRWSVYDVLGQLVNDAALAAGPRLELGWSRRCWHPETRQTSRCGGTGWMCHWSDLRARARSCVVATNVTPVRLWPTARPGVVSAARSTRKGRALRGDRARSRCEESVSASLPLLVANDAHDRSAPTDPGFAQRWPPRRALVRTRRGSTLADCDPQRSSGRARARKKPIRSVRCGG